MAVSWLVVLLALGVLGTIVVALVVFSVVMMLRSGNRESDGYK